MSVDYGPIVAWVLIYGLVCVVFGAGITWLIWPWIHRRGAHHRGVASQTPARARNASSPLDGPRSTINRARPHSHSAGEQHHKW